MSPRVKSPSATWWSYLLPDGANLTMALTVSNVPYKNGLGPLPPEVCRAALIDKQVGVGNLASVIIEPIQGEPGFIVPANVFLPALAAWCRANSVVFIVDEVQSGLGATYGGNPIACARGVIGLTCGTYGNVLRSLLPPRTTDDLLTEGLGTMTAALSEHQ